MASPSTENRDADVELGFLFLQECDLYLHLSSSSTDSEVSMSKWRKVEIPSRQSLDDAHAISLKEEDNTCPHCHFSLHLQENNRPLRLVGKGPRFDGTAVDTKPDPIHCSCQHRRRQRSDGALLMGLALTCQDLGHISMKTIQILVRENKATNRAETQTETDTDPHIRRTALAITFSIPEVSTQQSTRKSPSKSTKRRRFLSNSSKPLPPATQLLLSIMRSDWENLENILQHPEKIMPWNTTHECRLSLFPPKLSLEEVYQRIGGAASSLHEESDLVIQQQESASSVLSLIDLPKDVLKYRVGVYLKAQSLDALRGTCKSFHRILRSVVPGLKLRLYSHQVKSLSWMRVREAKQIVESDLTIPIESSSRLLYYGATHDAHRAASGGASVLLRARDQNDNLRISQYNGEEIIVCSEDPLSRCVARGGLLCDDPGLGKTITVVSLILQTLGLSTVNDDSEMHENRNEQIFEAYWREEIVADFRGRALNKLLSAFLRTSGEVDYFVSPVDSDLDDCPDYFDIVKDPICFEDIRRKVSRYEYGDSFRAFQSDVELCFSNAILYNPIGSVIRDAATRLNAVFLNMANDFMQKQIQVAKKYFARASAKPNSTVAALVERNNRVKLQKSLVPSSGTLLVVPGVLLEHWQDQLRLHVDLAYCTSKPPIIFEYRGTAECGLKMEEILVKCEVKQTHFPFVFVDKTGTRKLPTPHFLAMFSIVITSNQRFTNEWKNGSFAEELKRESRDDNIQNESDYRTNVTISEEACPLLKVNWLRMIVDEGHSMGRGKDNSAISFASWIAAERRWAMTGTPTRQTVSQSGLSSILNLMQYLQHAFFSRRQDGEAVWQNLVNRGWNQGLLSSFFRLRSLLSLLMVRHTKADIEELPPPRYRTTVLPMSAAEVKTYNTLVCAVQSNLLITSMKGKTSGAQDSLLHRSQAKHAKGALRNVRLVCSGGTQVIPTITEQFWHEFIRDFKDCNPSEERAEEMKQFLSRATTEQLTPCACCGMMLTTQLVFPCGDLVCTECVDPDATSCVVCDKEFDVDLFQRLQPGFVYEWLHNIEEEAKTKNKSMPSTGSSLENNENGVEVLEGGPGMLAPIDPDRLRRRTRKPGDGHECIYNPKDSNGQCELCWKEHDSCDLVKRSNRCDVCYRKAEMCPTSETKPFYVVQKLLELHAANQKRQDRTLVGKPKCLFGEKVPMIEKRPLKVIVFSQFRKVLNMAGDRMLRRFGTACIAEYWGHYRRQELHKFIYEDDCFCMLLGKDGSEGLDLSFVTHIFFLEQVWDKSLEQQAVARAWRMGAKSSVEVETLIAESSVEATMSRLEQSLEQDTHQVDPTDGLQGIKSATEAGKSSEYQRAKLQFLLKSLQLITNTFTTSFGGVKRKAPVAQIEESIEQALNKKNKKVRVRFKD